MLYYINVMEEELISKKEILSSTGISYGQFYRWKRKGLIPNRWLIHKSTRTGQESFLPEDKILPRIEKIKELKKDKSLNEIADLLSPELVQKKYVRSGLMDLDWIKEELLEAYEEIDGEKKFYSFRDLVYLMVLMKLKNSGESAKNTYLAVKMLNSLGDKHEFEEDLVVARKKPEYQNCKQESRAESGFCLIVSGEVRFDPSVEIVRQLKLSELVQELKFKLKEAGGLDREG